MPDTGAPKVATQAELGLSNLYAAATTMHRLGRSMTMRMIAMLLSALAVTVVTGSAHAAELAPIEGFSIKIANVTGTAYYTVEKDGYQVVATLASGEEATPIRFVATLLGGQKVMVSVPRAIGQDALEIEIERIEDRVFVSDATLVGNLDQ
jgi:hypothetical protein